MAAAVVLSGGCSGDHRSVIAITAPAPGVAHKSKLVRFIASGKDVVEGLAYFWSFGDGQTSSEKSPQHLYGSRGTYQVVLKCTTGSGRTVSTEEQVIVENVEPVVKAVDEYHLGTAPLRVQFQEPSAFDPDGPSSELRFAWDFGDGGGTDSSPGPVHIYEREGNYQAVLTVVDADGGVTRLAVPIGVLSPSSLAALSSMSQLMATWCSEHDAAPPKMARLLAEDSEGRRYPVSDLLGALGNFARVLAQMSGVVQVPVPFPADLDAQNRVVSSLLEEYPDLEPLTAACVRLFAKAAGWPGAQGEQAMNDTRLLEEIITYFL